jgi:hypothetical protein
MFSTTEQISRATWALCEAQLSALMHYMHAAVEAGVNAAEVQADAVRTSLASGTVMSRHWFDVGQASAWLAPARQFERVGLCALAATRAPDPAAPTLTLASPGLQEEH